MRKINQKKLAKDIANELWQNSMGGVFGTSGDNLICSPLTYTAKTKNLVKDNQVIIDFMNGQRFKITVTEVKGAGPISPLGK